MAGSINKSCSLEKTPAIIAFIKAQKNFSKSIYLLIMQSIMSHQGKAVDIYRRIKDHVTGLNTKNKNENPHLINSWHKHKRENFTYYVAEYITIEDRDELDNKLKDRELF